MMGRRRRSGEFFYEFRLDDRIPKDHLLRRIDGFVTAALARKSDFFDSIDPTRTCRGQRVLGVAYFAASSAMNGDVAS